MRKLHPEVSKYLSLKEACTSIADYRLNLFHHICYLEICQYIFTIICFKEMKNVYFSRIVTYNVFLENMGFSKVSTTYEYNWHIFRSNALYTKSHTKLLGTHQLYADIRFQNNLYLQVKDRQVQTRHFWEKVERTRPISYFWFTFGWLLNITKHTCN